MPDEWIDIDTGHRIVKLTRRAGANRSFYFHNHPFVGDEMLFVGTDVVQASTDMVAGNGTQGVIKQMYAVNLKTFEIRQDISLPSIVMAHASPAPSTIRKKHASCAIIPRRAISSTSSSKPNSKRPFSPSIHRQASSATSGPTMPGSTICSSLPQIPTACSSATKDIGIRSIASGTSTSVRARNSTEQA